MLFSQLGKAGPGQEEEKEVNFKKQIKKQQQHNAIGQEEKEVNIINKGKI